VTLAATLGVMFVRVWQYRVPPGRREPFQAAYGPQGPWADLFARSDGYLGTELYSDAFGTTSWITVDRWSDRRDWDDFLTTWRDDYDALDRELAGLALDEVELFAGAVAG
jgi:antibiotic biosynthesis monooxygenase